jgi:hypothetical protein
MEWFWISGKRGQPAQDSGLTTGHPIGNSNNFSDLRVISEGD